MGRIFRRAGRCDRSRHLPNHLNYAPPSTDVTSSTFGKITSVQTAENAGNRSGQVALSIELYGLRAVLMSRLTEKRNGGVDRVILESFP
jgi:hypothetical protein